MAPWPQPRLTVTASVVIEEVGRNLVTITVTNAKDTSGTGTATVWPGDGSGPQPVALDTTGSGSIEHRYLEAGHHTYTVRAVAPLPQLYATWTDLADANTTWALVPEAFTPWAEATATEETATTTVTVDVGGATVWAQVIDAEPLDYIQVSCWFSMPQTIIGWTLTRNAPGAVPAQNVKIWSSNAATTEVEIVSDREAPIGITVSYTLNVWRTGGVKTTFTSNKVTLTGTRGCFLTDPQSGNTMAIEVQEWKQRDTKVRHSWVAVAGRTDPIALSDVLLLPSGEWTLLTRTKASLEQLYSILGNARLVLLRTQPLSSLRTVYAAVGDFTETRVYPYDGTRWERYVDISIQEVMPIPATARMLLVTWRQLAEAYATWEAVADEFPSWLDVAQWNPAGVNTTLGVL